METTAEILKSLKHSPAIIESLLKQAPPQLLKKRPESGKWSIHEHICHLAEVHPLFFDRLELIVNQENPVIHSYEPGRDDDDKKLLNIDLAEAFSRYRTDRSRLIKRLETLTPEQWRKTAEHEEYNFYSVFVMIRHLALHDLFHGYRIEELLLQKDRTQPINTDLL